MSGGRAREGVGGGPAAQGSASVSTVRGQWEPGNQAWGQSGHLGEPRLAQPAPSGDPPLLGPVQTLPPPGYLGDLK